jgi:hypothetical protein
MRILGSTIRRLIVMIAFCIAGACTTLPSEDTPQEYLDKETAATISAAGRPIVFARERPELAVHMRDYVTIAAAAVDVGGRTDYVLIVYFWTTFDPHGRATSSRRLPGAEPPNLIVIGDDRRIELRLEAASAHDAGVGFAIHAPPDRDSKPNVYRTDLATLRYLAAARHLSVLDANDSGVSYEIWQDGRPALQALVRRLSGERE